jgi:hypothetical protein
MPEVPEVSDGPKCEDCQKCRKCPKDRNARTPGSAGSFQRTEMRELRKCRKFPKDGSARTARSARSIQSSEVRELPKVPEAPTLWLHADHEALGEPAGWAPVSRRLLHGAVTSSGCGQKVSYRAAIQRRGSILAWAVILSVYGAGTIAIDLSLSVLIS